MDNRKSKDEILVTDQNIDKENRFSFSRKVWQIYLPVGFIGLLVAATIWYAMSTGSRITKQYSPLVHAAMEVKLKVTTAHLWFEEIINGDRHKDIDEVWTHIDQAEWYTLAMLNGGQNEEGTLIPLDNPKFSQDILEALEKIRAFRNIAKERYANIDKSSIGSDIDQHFDAVFNSFLKQADNVETDLQQVMDRDIQRFQSLQIALIAFSLLLTGIIGVILNRYEHKQSNNLSMLKASNQQLTASEQQLKTSNQQLTASEQQLKATNQQLMASEQQLKTTNQQLMASEQQLKATNQELLLSQQKLALHVQQTPLAVIQWDLDFKVTEWNNAAEKIFGFTSKEAIGRHAAGLIVPELVKPIIDKVWNDLLTQKGGERSTNENNTKNNETIICEWYNTPLIDENGETIGVASQVLDITERKQTEEALRKSYELIKQERNMFISGAVVVFKWKNSEGWPVENVSPNVREVFGYSSEEFISGAISYAAIIPEEDIKRVADEVSTHSQSGADRFTHKPYRIVRKDGKTIWIEDYTTILRDKSGNITHYLGYVLDITERKQAEEQNRFLSSVVEQSADGMAIVNMEGKLLFVNDTWVSMHGYKNAEELIGQNLSIFHNEKQLKEVVEQFNQIVNEKGYNIGEVDHIRKDGTIFPTQMISTLMKDENGKPIAMSGVATDITERKRAEQNTKDLANILEKSLNEIYIFDAETFKFIQVNYGARENIGYSQEELTMLTPLDIKPNFTKELFIQLVEPLRNRTKEIITFETAHQRKDGSLYDVEVHLQLTQFLNKPVFVAIILDITETKRLQQLESRAERLEMAGTIAGQVAHDFNNLLGPIMAYPELIKEDLPHDHKTRAYLDDIESAAQKIANINQDLLTMGRRGHYNQNVLNLNRIVLQTVKDMELRTKNVVCEMDLSENLMNIKGGAAQIYRMLTNLFVNAQDAMQNVGNISIKTENYYADDTSISFGRVPKGEYVKLTITDTGCGIPENIIQKILDPFFSTKTTDKRRGSGLGLSIVDAVLKDHNAYLDLSSKVGHGTSFYIYFPVTREDIAESESHHTLGGNETILVVDDDEIQREVAALLLKRLGYKVNTIKSGEKAVEFLKENPQDLVILDMVMPGGIDGAETYQRILKTNSNQKAIILSGFSESDQVFKAQELGAGAFVKKPVTKNVIAAAVRTELDRPAKVSKT